MDIPMLRIAIGVSYYFFIVAWVYGLIWEGGIIIRDHYVNKLVSLSFAEWPSSPAPWRWKNWPKLDRRMSMLVIFFGISSFVWPPITPLPWLLGGLVGVRFGLRNRAWWKVKNWIEQPKRVWWRGAVKPSNNITVERRK